MRNAINLDENDQGSKLQDEGAYTRIQLERINGAKNINGSV
jgi:hypothetical protein